MIIEMVINFAKKKLNPKTTGSSLGKIINIKFMDKVLAPYLTFKKNCKKTY